MYARSTPHRAWDERETPVLLDAVDTRWTPTGLDSLSSPANRLFSELAARGAVRTDVRTTVTDLASTLGLNRKTISRAAVALSSRGFLLRDTSKRPQVWRLRVRPREAS